MTPQEQNPKNRDANRAVPQTTRDAEAVANIVTRNGIATSHYWPDWMWFSVCVIVWIAILGDMLAGNGSLSIYLLTTMCALTWFRRINRALAATKNALLCPELDMKWIGALIEALEWPVAKVRQVAGNRLVTLLPLLDKRTALQLTDARKLALTDRLTPWMAFSNPLLIRAILQAAPMLADEQAVKRVSSLATMTVYTRAMAGIRRLALRQLDILERRVLLKREHNEVIEEADSSEALPIENKQSALIPQEPQTTISQSDSSAYQEIMRNDVGGSPSMRLPFLIGIWVVVIPVFVFMSVFLVENHMSAQAAASILTTLALTQLHRLTLNRKHKELALALSKLDDMEAIGRLVDALNWPEPEIQAVVTKALCRLLPRMRASDGNLLNPQQRMILYRALKLTGAKSSSEFLIILLKSLEQIGDPDAIPFVRALAGSNPKTGLQRRVKQAAMECLPYLEERADTNRNSQVLLRVAASPGNAPDALLRPAVGEPDIPQEQLLRPRSAEDSATP